LLLLENGADFSIVDKDNRNPVCYSIFTKNEYILKLFISKGADIKSLDTVIYSCIESAKRGSTSILKILIENGANINIRNYNNHTALYYADKNGHEETSRLLKEAGGTK